LYISYNIYACNRKLTIYTYRLQIIIFFRYHSHVGSQYSEGLWGILIVQNKPEIYSYDEEFIVTLNDWYHRTAHENEEWHLSPISLGVPPYPDSGMINGLGRYNCDYAALQGRTCNASLQKRQVFEVHQNKTYRVRVINTGAYAMFNFSIDGHKLQPIEVDGVDIISETPLIDIATISSGQRYSFLIRTDENEKRYLMRAYLRVESLLLIVRENVTNINKYPEALDEKVTAVLQYSLKSNSSSNELLKLYTENHSYLDSVPPSPIKDPIYLDETLLSPHDGIYAPDRVDQEFILEIGFYEDHEDIRRGSFNQTPYKLPSDKPLLNYLLDGKEFPEESWSLEIQYMNVIQLVINNPFFGPHPFHLHGHHFWVLGTGAIDDGNYNATKYNLTLTGAKRDTFLIQEQSWAVIRFVADNPGVWLFHCHIDWHGLSGMAVTFIEARERFVRDVKLTHEAKRICELWRSGSSSSSGSNLGLMWYKSDISSYFYSCNSLLLYFVYFVSFMSVSRIFPVAIISIKNINAANCK